MSGLQYKALFQSVDALLYNVVQCRNNSRAGTKAEYTTAGSSIRSSEGQNESNKENFNKSNLDLISTRSGLGNELARVKTETLKATSNQTKRSLEPFTSDQRTLVLKNQTTIEDSLKQKPEDGYQILRFKLKNRDIKNGKLNQTPISLVLSPLVAGSSEYISTQTFKLRIGWATAY
jgi:hypothetical protein